MIEFFTENLWLLWIVAGSICLTLELSSGDFFITCFAVGALAAAASDAFGAAFWLQVIVFAAVSVMSIFFIRPALVARLQAKADHRVSNADALIGRIGRVTEQIEQGGFGRVQIDGDDWKAESKSNKAIAKGLKVKVVGRESIILDVIEA